MVLGSSHCHHFVMGRRNSHNSNNTVHKGTVISVDPITRSFSVQLNGKKGIVVRNCVWAAGLFSGLLGMKTTFIPTPGTSVLVVPGPPAFVVGCIPTDAHDPIAGDSRTLTGSGKKRSETSTGRALKTALRGSVAPGATPGSDMLEGELEIGNSLGVSMALLTTIARMTAGGRAKIEACLLNDMVRIVSDVFKHHTAFGDIEIYNDGRLNCRVNGTSYEHEAWGLLKPKDKKVANSDSIVDLTSVDRMIDTGRWRYSEFIGFLGDMVHQFVSEPTAVIGKFAADAARAGKSRFQMMNDGTMLMQSVTEIVIERVSRIPVPIEKKRWDDPTGSKKADMDKLKTDYLKIWEYGKDPKDIAKTCYQLREYARWLSGMHSYARFLQMEDDWNVPSETASPASSWTNAEDDVEKVNPNMDRELHTYSCFRIMRDGSQILLDGYGNAYVASFNGVQLSSAKHMEIYSAGDLSIAAGRNLYLKARRNIEIAAIVGGLKIKARTWLQGLCEWGSVWLKSDADATSPQTPVEGDPEPVIMEAEMLLETTKGKTRISSEKQLLLEIKRGGADNDMVLQTQPGASVRVIAGKDISISGKGGLFADMSQHIVLGGISMTADLVSKTFVVPGAMKVSGAGLHVERIVTNNITAVGNIRGPENKRGKDQHQNHISTIGDNEEGPDTSSDAVEVPENEPVDPLEAGVTWDFFDSSEYVDSDREMFETLSEQRARTDSDISSDYGTWTMNQSALRSAKRTGSKAPFPGKAALRWIHTGGQDLHKPTNTLYSAQVTAPTGFTQKTISYKFLK